MKKIVVLITLILLVFSIQMKAQDKETIIELLNNSNEKSTYLKDFSFKLEPGKNTEYSIILSKNTKYEFSLYLENPELDFDLYADKSDINLISEKEKIADKITKVDFLCKQTGVYLIRIKNNSAFKAKSTLLLSFLSKTQSTDTGDELVQNETLGSVEEKSKTEKFEENVYLTVETMPKFIDPETHKYSHTGFREFIQKNIIYPEEAKTKKLEGKVYVSFVVDKDGYIKDAKVVRGSHASLNQEALRVVLSSPRWEPGKEKGQPVSVSFTFPITFSLK